MQRQRTDEGQPTNDHPCDGNHDNDSNGHPNDRRRRYHSKCCRQAHISSLGSISNLCSATLGAGALSLPYAFSLTGLIPGILLIFFSAYASIVSIDLIIEACVNTNLFKYEDVAVRLAGSRAGKALEFSLLIFCFGTAVAYIMAVGDILDQGLRSVWGSQNDSQNDSEYSHGFSIYSREHIMIIFWIMVMFPLSLQRSVESLEYASSLGVLSIIFLVVAAVIHSITHGNVIGNGNQHVDDGLEPKSINSMLWPESFWDVIKAVPIIIFAFSCQVNVCAIFEELTPSSNRTSLSILESKQTDMSSITRLGIALCTALYIFMGVFGFLDFANHTSDNILTNYCVSVTHDPLMIAASIFVAVAVVVAYPFNILPARVTLKLIWDRMQQKHSCGIIRRVARRIQICLCRYLSRSNDHRTDKEPTENATTDTIPQNNVGGDGLSSSAMEPLLLEDELGNHSVPAEGVINENDFAMASTPEQISSPTEHFVLTLILSGSALIAALLIPNISAVFGLMGGTAASIISFILPGMFLLQMENELSGSVSDDDSFSRLISTLSSREMPPSTLQSLSPRNHMRRRRNVSLAWAFIIGGTMMGVLSTGVTLYGMFEQSSNVSGTGNTCDSSGDSKLH